MILLTLQRWFTLSNPITHMLWGFKFGRGTLCLLQHLRPHLPTAARHVTPFFMSSNSFFLFHCLQFYRLTGSQAKFLFVSEQEVWPETSQSPCQAAGLTCDSPLSLTPLHILLTFSFQSPATSVFFFSTESQCQVQTLIFLKLFCSWTLLWIPFPYIAFCFSWDLSPFLKHIYHCLDASKFL